MVQEKESDILRTAEASLIREPEAACVRAAAQDLGRDPSCYHQGGSDSCDREVAAGRRMVQRSYKTWGLRVVVLISCTR